MAILLISASNKVRNIPEFNGSDRLKKIDKNLKTAYILTFIVAGIVFLIGSAYSGHETLWCPSEWWHGTFGVISLIILVIAIIYAYIALNDLYTPDLEDRNGSDLYIWASLIISIFAFLTVGAIGSGRVGYNAIGTDSSDRLYMAEKKLHETHSAITGQLMENKKRPSYCKDGCDNKKETSKSISQTYVMTEMEPKVVQRSPVHRIITKQEVAQQEFNGLRQDEQPLGPPIITRHSVVTTSQPMMSSPIINGTPTHITQSTITLPSLVTQQTI